MSLESLSRLGFGGSGGPDALPKVLAELQGLTFTFATGANANTAITVAGLEREDTIAAILNMTDLSNVNVAHATIQDRRATGTITLTTGIEDGDTIAVNGKTYTFKEFEVNPSHSPDVQVVPITVNPSGIDIDVVGARLASIIMSNDSNIEASNADGVVTITWRTPGTVGNAKTLSVTGSNSHATRSGATLSGGTATATIKISDSTSGKTLLVIWYNKTP